MSNRVDIEVQDRTGNWRRVSTTTNNAQSIRLRMNEAARGYKGYRVRAVDDGHVVDILT